MKRFICNLNVQDALDNRTSKFSSYRIGKLSKDYKPCPNLLIESQIDI